MLEKVNDGEIRIRRDPRFVGSSGKKDGCFTLGNLEEFIATARANGITTNEHLWFNYNGVGDRQVAYMFFKTSDMLYRSASGRPVIVVGPTVKILLSVIALLLLALLFI